MRDRDIKLLWGRAGNRCAICKRELTLAGGKDTLGEMAHICAKSPDGPRGDRGADEVFLNSYENRILLCPTDHIEIDRDAAAWTVERLIRTKNDHEAWVGEQLGRATIAVARADNTAFLNTRRNAWSEKAQRAVAVSVALTPLQLGEVLDPVTGDGPRLLAEARLPGDEPLNRYKTRPDQNGLINERETPLRYSIAIFRVGHCEYFYSLRDEVAKVLRNANQVVDYTDVAEVIRHATGWLFHVWRSLLPHMYMTYTATLINSARTNLYVGDAPAGFPTGAEQIEYSDVVEKGAEEDRVVFYALERVARTYGLVLDSLFDSRGTLLRPRRMSNSEV